MNLIHSNGKVSALRWQICGATSEILQWIIDILYEQYNIPKVNIHVDNSPNRKKQLLLFSIFYKFYKKIKIFYTLRIVFI